MTTYTVYDGQHAWADFDSNGNATTSYLYGDGSDELIARWRPTDGTAWFLTDHLGTVHDIVNASGSIITTITYDSFGQIVSVTNPSFADRFSYTGREFDSESGLHYYRARYYSPGLGRFISEDSLGFVAGDMNLYRYVGNMPISATDPSGNQAVMEWLAKTEVQLAIGVGCALTELAFDGKWNNPVAVASTTFSVFLGIGAGRLIGGGIVYAITSKAVGLRVVGGVLAIGLGAGGLGLASYGVYDTYVQSQAGNKSFGGFLTRLLCTSVDFGIMVGSARAGIKRLAEGELIKPGYSMGLIKSQMKRKFEKVMREQYNVTVKFVEEGGSSFNRVTNVITINTRTARPSTLLDPVHCSTSLAMHSVETAGEGNS